MWDHLIATLQQDLVIFKGQSCNQESSIKLTYLPCTIICIGNCPTVAAALVNQDSPETRCGVSAATNGKHCWKSGKQFSPTGYVKAQYLVSVSEKGCCPLGALLKEKGQQLRVPRHRALLPRAAGKRGWIPMVCSKLFSAYVFVIAKIRHPKRLLMQNAELGMCCPLYIKVIDSFRMEAV